jgi:hypothetical protein
MKKDLAIHFSYLTAFFIIITLVRGWLSIDYVPFWVGGVLGAIFPYVDYFIYIYVLNPNEAAAEKEMISNRQYARSLKSLTKMRSSGKDLIIHAAYFQIMFVVFAFLIITSSGSLMGRGLVLAFLLHLLIDQVVDLMERGNIDNWFRKLPIVLDAEQKKWYLAGNALVLIIFALFL